MVNKGKEELSTLRQAYGDEVELQGDDGASQLFRIMAELNLNGNNYAILQSEAMKQEDEIEAFRVVADPSGDVQLETITDEDEWEQVAEAYDDSRFGSDDQP
ncbi:DUF1292 domain-containing protein [Cohnella silvisoli]|uniref:DUF1292 domain-containing protein n=1 Tax=Cohnella silvisoli TaxID=2873699 RepID=A0ABV1KW84_9BACL|nr:DUF1292 domain-containing protein [Cohnella silvisoli]MCD9023087.1 DUF1292 domain-containing protein [Cohnella silvisoli]